MKTISLSFLLVISILAGSLPPKLGAETARAEGELFTNSTTILDLNDLRSKVSDHTDTDGDGLWDQVEKILGTAVEIVDTDSDGLTDLFELENGLDPLKADTNSSGLSDRSRPADVVRQ